MVVLLGQRLISQIHRFRLALCDTGGSSDALRLASLPPQTASCQLSLQAVDDCLQFRKSCCFNALYSIIGAYKKIVNRAPVESAGFLNGS
jgi:hypothetical protein